MNVDQIIQILKDINIAQLIAIAIILWFFYSRLDKKIDKLENRIEKLEEKVSGLDCRISRLEGAFTLKECCMLKDERKLPKAE